MFGRGWVPGTGTVVTERELSVSSNGYGVYAGEKDEFLVDVVSDDGQVRFRGRTRFKSGPARGTMTPQIGQTYRVLIDPKKQRIQFDDSDPKLHRPTAKEGRKLEQEAFDRVAAVTPDPADMPGGVPTDEQLLTAWRALIAQEQIPVVRGQTTPADARAWTAARNGLKGNLDSLRGLRPDWQPPADEVAEADRKAAELSRSRGFSR